MTMAQILAELRSYAGVLELAPQPDSGYPAISWGDHFFYYAPDGEVPRNQQPYATITTKDCPDDTGSRLDAPIRWRLNIHVGPDRFTELLGYPPSSAGVAIVDFSATDVFLPHPLYGVHAWVAVVNPSASTTDRALELLQEAHLADRRRVERREGRTSAG
jgi:hypothetical protein